MNVNIVIAGLHVVFGERLRIGDQPLERGGHVGGPLGHVVVKGELQQSGALRRVIGDLLFEELFAQVRLVVSDVVEVQHVIHGTVGFLFLDHVLGEF